MGFFQNSKLKMLNTSLYGRKTVDLCQKMEATGVSWVAVHGRTKEQRNQPVNLEAIKLIRHSVGVPVVANGDIKSLEDVSNVTRFTDVQGNVYLHMYIIFTDVQGNVYLHMYIIFTDVQGNVYLHMYIIFTDVQGNVYLHMYIIFTDVQGNVYLHMYIIFTDVQGNVYLHMYIIFTDVQGNVYLNMYIIFVCYDVHVVLPHYRQCSRLIMA